MPEENVSEKPIAMLVNVGGGTSPAIHTLNEQQPLYICFFVSHESKSLIKEKILPELKYIPEHYDWVETPAPQNLLMCYKTLQEELPRVLKKWGVDPSLLGVEYTAGTKPMSVAAILATIDTSSQFFYVGAADKSGRDRDGIGVVLDGKECSLFETNPWEQLAINIRKEIALLFNHGRFTDAQERALKLSRVAQPDMRQIYEALAEMVEGYALWDRFEYKEAQTKLGKSVNKLKLYIAGRDDPLKGILDIVEKQVLFLGAHNDTKDKSESARLDILDLVANADRRAKLAKKYDDATARLYSALELLAHNRLKFHYEINTGNVKKDQIPESLCAEFLQRYSDPDNPERIKLPLNASYQLLTALKDELGEAYTSNELKLKSVLNCRNNSRLAHGTNPVREDTFIELRSILISFAKIDENELPVFPTLTI
jgi:CRISPR-associated protein (TIGR02710 family)